MQHSSIFVKQTKRGCVQELLGCEANNEFKIFPSADAAKQGDGAGIMYSLEDTSLLCRLCCNNNRAFKQTIWQGTKDAKGEEVLYLNRPLACNMAPCTCCNFKPFMQTLEFSSNATMAATPDVGSIEIPCFICVPVLKVKNAAGELEYDVQMPTCMGGVCVDVFAEGLCNCKIPFYIYKPGVEPTKENSSGKIIKMWRGMGTEIFTDAASFQLDFPEGADAGAKGRLLGTTIFINMYALAQAPPASPSLLSPACAHMLMHALARSCHALAA